MHADPSDQKRLLDLQRADTALMQLTHARKNVPETETIAQLRKLINEITDKQAQHSANASDLERDISRVEREIEQVRARAQKDRDRQLSGSASPKELESLTQELETLARRQSELEDHELELMEEREQAQAAAVADDEVVARHKEDLAATEARLADKISQIDSQLKDEQTARTSISESLPQELVELYERLRKRQPIAAALLRHRKCESCRIEQSGGDLAGLRAAAPGDVMRCDNCGAILVRTQESGL